MRSNAGFGVLLTSGKVNPQWLLLCDSCFGNGLTLKQIMRSEVLLTDLASGRFLTIASYLHSHTRNGLKYSKLLCVKMRRAGWGAFAISHYIAGRCLAVGRGGGINHRWWVLNYLWEFFFFIFFFFFLCSLRFACFAPAFGALEVRKHVRILLGMCRNRLTV